MADDKELQQQPAGQKFMNSGFFQFGLPLVTALIGSRGRKSAAGAQLGLNAFDIFQNALQTRRKQQMLEKEKQEEEEMYRQALETAERIKSSTEAQRLAGTTEATNRVTEPEAMWAPGNNQTASGFGLGMEDDDIDMSPNSTPTSAIDIERFISPTIDKLNFAETMKANPFQEGIDPDLYRSNMFFADVYPQLVRMNPGVAASGLSNFAYAGVDAANNKAYQERQARLSRIAAEDNARIEDSKTRYGANMSAIESLIRDPVSQMPDGRLIVKKLKYDKQGNVIGVDLVTEQGAFDTVKERLRIEAGDLALKTKQEERESIAGMTPAQAQTAYNKAMERYELYKESLNALDAEANPELKEFYEKAIEFDMGNIDILRKKIKGEEPGGPTTPGNSEWGVTRPEDNVVDDATYFGF